MGSYLAWDTQLAYSTRDRKITWLLLTSISIENDWIRLDFKLISLLRGPTDGSSTHIGVGRYYGRYSMGRYGTGPSE